MTAVSTVRCDYCETTVPADEAFKPFRAGPVNRCKDAAACGRRADALHDPTLWFHEWNRPVPPPAVSGAKCAFCRTTSPDGGVIECGAGHACRDRVSCEQRQGLDLAPWTDSSPDGVIEATGGRFQIPTAHPPQAGPGPAEPTHEEMAALAASEALGRKRR